MSEIRALAREVALAAGALLLERFGAPVRGVMSKSSATDLVTDADRDAEVLVARLIGERRPYDGIVGEEGARREGTSGLRWIVDPLDGTVNFVYGIPHWCVALACADEKGTIVGVVHDPPRNETFVAERGRGAWLGEHRLRVSDQRELGRALVATGFGYDAEVRRRQGATVARVLPRVRDLRRPGSAALDLAWVAAARYDGYFESGVNPWDVEAGILLVREAAGEVTRLEGIGQDRRPAVVATNPRIHAALLEALRPDALARD